MTDSKDKLVNMNKAIDEANDIAEQTYYLEQKVYEWNQIIVKNKEKLSSKLGKRSRWDITIDDNNKFSITKDIKANISFFIEKLAIKLDKERYRKIVNRTVTIKNLEGLIKLLKKNGIDPKEFKSYINISETPNTEAIDTMMELEELTVDELVGCYSVKFDEKINVKKIK